MSLGNNVFGINIEKNYFAMYLFPIGIEIFICQGIELAFTLLNLEICLTLKENNTLFRND